MIFFAALGAVFAKPLVKFADRRLVTFIHRAVGAVSFIVLALSHFAALALAIRAIQGIVTGVNRVKLPRPNIAVVWLVPSTVRKLHRNLLRVAHIHRVLPKLLRARLHWDLVSPSVARSRRKR
jgi:hypothetical protein